MSLSWNQIRQINRARAKRKRREESYGAAEGFRPRKAKAVVKAAKTTKRPRTYKKSVPIDSNLSTPDHNYLARTYNITPDFWRAMHEKQEGACPVCHTDHRDEPLVVDHNHATGKVRGLLCSLCNLGLGHMRDTPAFIANLLCYLLESTATDDKLHLMQPDRLKGTFDTFVHEWFPVYQDEPAFHELYGKGVVTELKNGVVTFQTTAGDIHHLNVFFSQLVSESEVSRRERLEADRRQRCEMIPSVVH